VVAPFKGASKPANGAAAPRNFFLDSHLLDAVARSLMNMSSEGRGRKRGGRLINIFNTRLGRGFHPPAQLAPARDAHPTITAKLTDWKNRDGEPSSIPLTAQDFKIRFLVRLDRPTKPSLLFF